ncbi:DNA/pantothenate metabolism flavoprotein [Meredithblackwellia eburnea MCA 4105]
MSEERPQFSADEFFASQPKPPRLEEHLEQVRSFVERNVSSGRRVVLITSGGTTVPLEHNVVRFLDNFSAGTRGSASAEHFLRTGQYAVIFLHRQHSLQPFSRHYSHSTNPFLDLLDVVGDSVVPNTAAPPGMLFPPVPQVGTPVPSQPGTRSGSPVPHSQSHPHSHPHQHQQHSLQKQSPAIQISPPHVNSMLSLLRSYKLVQSLGILHSIAFTSIDEYLFLLRGVSQVMSTAKDLEGKALGRRGMYYLAAAVSDFFIPRQRMSEHKIQSGKGSLIIEMDQVPKVLKAMVDEWSNDGFIVSFKLETDINLLIPKARAALERYGHQVVIGNTLADRKHEVVFVERGRESWVRIGEEDRGAIGTGGEEREIEEDIIKRLVEMHDGWIR